MDELLTILLGATPIGEVRVAIPVALAVFHFTPIKAYLLGVFGNILPILPVLLFLNYLSEWLMHRFYYFNKFFTWFFQYTRERHQQHFEKYGHEHPEAERHRGWGLWGPVALWIFVAVPIPFTGVWSGCIAAFVFGIPQKRAFLAIAAGAAVAGLITLTVSLGVIGGIKLL